MEIEIDIENVSPIQSSQQTEPEHNINKVSAVRNEFNWIGDRKYRCKHCGTNYKENASYFKKHIVRQCINCPFEIRVRYATSDVPVPPEFLPSHLSPDTNIRHLSQQEQQEYIIATCKNIYCEGLPFNSVSKQFYVKSQRILAHDAQIPTPKDVANKYLKVVFEREWSKMLANLQRENYVTIMLDGWKHKQWRVVNVLAVCRDHVYYLKSIVLEPEIIENHEYVVDKLNILFEELPILESKCVAIVSDNGSNYKKAIKLFVTQHFLIQYYTCCNHNVNLILSDLIKKYKQRTLRNGTVRVYPAGSFRWLFDCIVFLAKVGRSVPSIHEPTPSYSATRWISMLEVAEFDIRHIRTLSYELTIHGHEQKYAHKQELIAQIQSPDFIFKLEKFLDLLRFLFKSMQHIERRDSTLSNSLTTYYKIYQYVLNHYDEEIALKVLQRIDKTGYQDILSVAVYLDPFKSNMVFNDAAFGIRISKVHTFLYRQLQMRNTNLTQQMSLTQFKVAICMAWESFKRVDMGEFADSNDHNLSPAVFWLSDSVPSTFNILKEFAIMVYSMCPTSCEVFLANSV